MAEKARDSKKIMDQLDKVYFLSNVNLKQRPPISPITHETRELARRSLEEFKLTLEKTREKLDHDKTAFIDGARLSGIKSGDLWEIDKSGIKTRHFEKNEQLLAGILQRRTERVADPEREVSLETLLDILSYAQWAPNATNEQPTRIMIYHKDHPSMEKIGRIMHQALHENMIPDINIKNYILTRKKENPNFLPDYSLRDLSEMDDETFKAFHFEEMPAPLNELPQTTDKLFERNKIVSVNGRYYLKKNKQEKGEEYKIKHLLANDKIFTTGMGKFFLKFKNTHPYLIIVFRKWHYTSLMTETLYKYGIKLPDVGEEFIDAGCYTDHLALATRGFGLSGVIKTGPLDLAKDELTELFVHDLEDQMAGYREILKQDQGMPAAKQEILKKELKKSDLLYQGLKYGLEAMRCKDHSQAMREPLLTALKRGEVFVPATFFQLGYPLDQLEERLRDPRQGKNSLDQMMILMAH